VIFLDAVDFLGPLLLERKAAHSISFRRLSQKRHTRLNGSKV